ncbi:N-acetyl-alpha-D-glucosaminyl L-malate synthase [Chlamydiales bacterium SCGC AG-110-P3]|nr:N-acetyl-alpha-D-glucosaminyl L-malate synthase [Chlamydiales bacterium SCGC AG-110-P3]
MKIGMVCYPTIGGSGVVATELGKQLARRGHEVHFITYEIPFRLTETHSQISYHKVDVLEYDLFRYPDYALTLAVKIAEVADRQCLDVVHVHYAVPHAVSAFLAKQLTRNRLRVVTTLHGTDITLVGRGPAYHQLACHSIEVSDIVTAVSQYLCKQTAELFTNTKPILYIPNFILPKDLKASSQRIRRQFARDDEKLLVHVSNFRPLKRLGDVIEIFESVSQVLDARLLLVGTGVEMDETRRLVAEKHLSDCVTFYGASPEVDTLVSVADLMLLPSSQESFGLAALEAMVYGVPVVATETGGLPELILHGETGLLAPIGDVRSMAQQSIDLLSDDDRYRAMSCAVRSVAREKYSPMNIVAQYEAVYATAMTLT